MIYFYFPTKDTTIYEEFKDKNTGKDEILELTKLTSGSSKRVDGSTYDETLNTRILLQFDYTALSSSINDGDIPVFDSGSTTSASGFMKLHVSEENAITDQETIVMRPLSMSSTGSWNEGLGRDHNINENGLPIATLGASWANSKIESNEVWNTNLIDGSNDSNEKYFATTSGGGTWHSNDLYSGSQDLTNLSGDLNLDITGGLSASLANVIANKGWIIKRLTANESDSGRYGSHKYFSIDTHTIYAPKLEIKWDDSSFDTGSLSELTADDILVYVNNNRGEYKENSRERIRVVGRERYPTKTYATSSDNLTVKYLPTTSYYGIKDMHTEEMIIDFDTTYTKLSCDSTGNYFDLWMDGLQPERYYRLLFRVDRGTKKQYFDDDIVFKIVR